MKCEHIRVELSLLLPGEAPSSGLGEHLRHCTGCRSFANQVQKQNEQMATLVRPVPSDWAWLVRQPTETPRIVAETTVIHPMTRKERTFGKIAVAVALAASLLVATIGLLPMLRFPQIQEGAGRVAKTDGPKSQPAETGTTKALAPAALAKDGKPTLNPEASPPTAIPTGLAGSAVAPGPMDNQDKKKDASQYDLMRNAPGRGTAANPSSLDGAPQPPGAPGLAGPPGPTRKEMSGNREALLAKENTRSQESLGFQEKQGDQEKPGAQDNPAAMAHAATGNTPSALPFSTQQFQGSYFIPDQDTHRNILRNTITPQQKVRFAQNLCQSTTDEAFQIAMTGSETALESLKKDNLPGASQAVLQEKGYGPPRGQQSLQSRQGNQGASEAPTPGDPKQANQLGAGAGFQGATNRFAEMKILARPPEAVIKEYEDFIEKDITALLESLRSPSNRKDLEPLLLQMKDNASKWSELAKGNPKQAEWIKKMIDLTNKGIAKIESRYR